MVGKSKRDITQMFRLHSHALRNGHFFKLYDDDTQLFLRNIAMSLGWQVCQLPLQVISVADMYRQEIISKISPDIPATKFSRVFYTQILQPATHYSKLLDVIRDAESVSRNKPKV